MTDASGGTGGTDDLDAVDADLLARTRALLEPGEIELNGAIVHTDLSGREDLEMMQATLDAGEVIAAEATDAETYVYSGNDDPEFASNQHQALTLEGDEFVWECQQLLREGSFALVFYYEADADQDAIVEGIEALGFAVTSVESP